MSKTTTYRQCCLVRKVEGEERVMVSFLPDKFSVEGKWVDIKNTETGVWSNGWKVKSAFSVTSAEDVEKLSGLYRHHRKATDI